MRRKWLARFGGRQRLHPMRQTARPRQGRLWPAYSASHGRCGACRPNSATKCPRPSRPQSTAPRRRWGGWRRRQPACPAASLPAPARRRHTIRAGLPIPARRIAPPNAPVGRDCCRQRGFRCCAPRGTGLPQSLWPYCRRPKNKSSFQTLSLCRMRGRSRRRFILAWRPKEAVMPPPAFRRKLHEIS